MRPRTRWHVAGLVRRWFPDVRGRDRLLTYVGGSEIPAALRDHPVHVRFGPGLQATVRLDEDGSFANFFFAQYEDPVLVPILEAVLSEGAVFYDVGANVGIYTLWGSRLVGSTGHVFSFEPVPSTATWLDDILAQNEITNVDVVRQATSSTDGEVTIELVPHASGRSHVVGSAATNGVGGVGDGASGSTATGVTTVGEPAVPASAAAVGAVANSAPNVTPDVAAPNVTATTAGTTVTVPSTSIDSFARTHPAPTLVKIDVEGHEPEVLDGMREVLDSARPAVVFEAPDYVGAARGSSDLVELFGAHGYRMWSLTTRGLAPFTDGAFSHNILALHTSAHADVQRALASTHFNRNQNT